MLIPLKPDFFFKDDRGSLTQLCRRGFSQVNVIHSFAGAKRGGHLHELNAETFYVISGKCEVVCPGEKAVFEAGEMFLVPPGLKHSFTFLEDSTLVSMYSLGVELADGSLDIHTESEE